MSNVPYFLANVLFSFSLGRLHARVYFLTMKGNHTSELMLTFIGPWHYVYAHSRALLYVHVPAQLISTLHVQHGRYVAQQLAAHLSACPLPMPVPTSSLLHASPCGAAVCAVGCWGVLPWAPDYAATAKLSGSALTD